ncbi:MAG: BACON domain-containing protein [Bacteroidales bacterium]
MKKIILSPVYQFIVLAFIMLFSVGSFAQTNDIIVSKSYITFNAAASTDTFSIQSTTNWIVTSNQTWLIVSPVSGTNNGIVNLSATSNTGTTIREAIITVSSAYSSSASTSKIIHIKQLALSPTTTYLNVSRNNILLPSANACSDTFKITSNVNWAITVTGTASSTTIPTWLTVAPIAGVNNLIINLFATANTTNAIRTALVKITSGTLVKTIEVKQAAASTTISYLNVSRNNILLPSANACTDTFAITSNVNWTIAVTGTSSSTTIPTWLSVNPVAGVNNLIINMAATANTTNAIRTALIKVTSGTLMKTIEVKQPAASTTISYLNVSRNNILLPSANACTDTFAITSNVNWTIAVTGTSSSTTIPTWLSVNPVAGVNNLIINMAATANTTNAIRTALIKVTSGTLMKTIEVKQPAATATISYLNVSRNNILLPSANACNDTFKITSNVNWTIAVTGTSSSTTIPTWLSVNPVAGVNNLIINMAATANTTNAIRTALIKVTSGTLVKTIEVKQPAANATNSYLYVSRNNILLPSANACSDTFAITSNVNWTISITGTASSTTIPTWLSVNPIAGVNNLIINMAATANTTNAIRTALIKVTSGTLVKTIEVKQPTSSATNSYLNVSRNNILLPSANACIDTFKITSNVIWTVSVFPSVSSGNPITWLTVNPTAGSNNLIIHLNATPNTSTTFRTALVKVTSGSLVKTIEVKQAAGLSNIPFLNLSVTSLMFDAIPSISKTFNITSNSGWIITTDVSWLSFSPSSGNNNASITVTASANTSAQMRLGWLVISIPGSMSKFIQIKQAGTANPIISDNSFSSSKSASGNISAYPNPAIDNITLTSLTDFTDNDFVEIYSLEGLIIYKQALTGNNVKIDFQSLKTGIYFIKISQNNEVIVKTISKN